jgi:hypothetical protein
MKIEATRAFDDPELDEEREGPVFDALELEFFRRGDQLAEPAAPEPEERATEREVERPLPRSAH